MSLYKGTTLIAGTRDNRANTDLSNLSSTGEKHFLNKQQISNCILEDPQNISLELSSGTLTLKAGSVVCVPNGFESDGTTPKFDEVTIASDVSMTTTTNNAQIPTMYHPTIGIYGFPASGVFSGTTAPTGQTYMYWYDTTNNIIKRTIDGGTTWESSGWSFPFCLATHTSSTISSIDQTFQSIGYIGSTFFVRKEMKVLIPNYKNSDGTLNNLEQTQTGVDIYTYPSTQSTTNSIMCYNHSSVLATRLGNWTSCTYNPDKNIIVANGSIETNAIPIGTCTVTSGAISNFKPYTATNILKYSDMDSNTSFKALDGQWVSNGSTIYSGSGLAIGTTSFTHSLSSYLPDDGYSYEVSGYVRINTGSTANSTVITYISTDAIAATTAAIARTSGTNGGSDAASFILPVSASRNMYSAWEVTKSASANVYLVLNGYRRIGTNS